MLDSRILLPAVKNRVDVPSLMERVFGETETRGALMFCPFHRHNRNTPSFHVQDEGARWRCYSCGLHGDVIDFWRNAYRGRTGRTLTFEGAVGSLATLAGIASDGPPTPATMLLIARALRENPRATRDPMRERIEYEARELLWPLVRSVRFCGLIGAWDDAIYLEESLDEVLGRAGRPYSAVWADVLDVERQARRFLRTAESVAEWEKPEEIGA